MFKIDKLRNVVPYTCVFIFIRKYLCDKVPCEFIVMSQTCNTVNMEKQYQCKYWYMIQLR